MNLLLDCTLYYYAASGCLIKLFASTENEASWQIKLKGLVEKGVTDVWLKLNIAKTAPNFACCLFRCIKQCPVFFARLCYLRL